MIDKPITILFYNLFQLICKPLNEMQFKHSILIFV